MLINGLFDFQEKCSYFDRKNNFTDGSQGRLEVKRGPKRQRNKLGAGHGRATATHSRAAVAEKTHGQAYHHARPCVGPCCGAWLAVLLCTAMHFGQSTIKAVPALNFESSFRLGVFEGPC